MSCFNHRIIILALALLVTINNSAIFGCYPFDPDDPPEINTGVETGTEAPNPEPNQAEGSSAPGDTGGATAADPVLVSSGEFLFNRTDSVISDDGLVYSFPLVRTYRTKPAPAWMQSGVDENGESGDSGSTLYTDARYFRWERPTVTSRYIFIVSLSISPSTGVIEVPASSINIDPFDPLKYTTRAFRFELGTGITYTVQVEFTRKDPIWRWDENINEWVVDGYELPVGLDTWETEITIPYSEDIDNNIPNMMDAPFARGSQNEFYSSEWVPGWDISSNMYLINYPDETPNDNSDDRKIHFHSGDGNVYAYTYVSSNSNYTTWECITRNDYLRKFNSNGYCYLFMKNNHILSFDAEGYIRRIFKNDKSVWVWNYSSGYGIYGDLKRLESMSDIFGRKIEFSYIDATEFYPGNLSKIRDWNGREWNYDYYTDGNLKEVTDPEGYVETYVYTAEGYLEIVKDDAGNIWLDNDYDSSGRVYYQTMGTDSFTFDYTDPEEVVVTDSQGAETIHTLNDHGFAISEEIETETSSVTTNYTYDSNNRVESVTYPEGNGYSYDYDNYGNLTEVNLFSADQSDPDLSYTVTYDTSNISKCYLTSVTDSNGNITAYDYNINGLLTDITYPEVLTDQGLQNPQISFTYTSNNQLETIASPDGIVSKYIYWNDIEEPNYLGLVKNVILDYGTDPECKNITYSYDYDSTGQIKFITDPYNNTTTLTYDLLGLISQIENADGDISKFTYNADRKLTKLEREYDGGWQAVDYGYNIMAKLTSITNSLGQETTLGYDSRYQNNSIEDGNGNETTKDYSLRKQVKEVVDAESASTLLHYDDNGHLAVITDDEIAGTAYSNDGYGRLEYITYADYSYEQLIYDSNGNVTTFRNRAGEEIDYFYDAMNRLKIISKPTQNVFLTYDIAGRLVSVNQGESLSFDYDRLGRMEETTDENGYTVGYEYDDMGRRTKLIYPDSSYITYDYDNVGRLEYIKDSSGYTIVQYVYDELSRTALLIYYHESVYVGAIVYDFEDLDTVADDNLGNRISEITYYNAANHSISYTYDQVGNITNMDVGGNYDWNYCYDDIYQLECADQGTATNRTIDYTYDSVYNRTYWNDSVLGSLTYSDNAMNQYSAIGSTTPTYDSRGNITSFGSGYMTYDCENRLVSAGQTIYSQDLLGRRYMRWSPPNDTLTEYVWDGDHIIAEYTDGNLIKYIYGPGMDNPVAMVNSSGTQEIRYYYYADVLGNVRMMTDSAGFVVESYAYDPFGMPYVMTSAGTDGNWLTEDVSSFSVNSYGHAVSTIGNSYMFTGRRWDEYAGLYYYRMRDYSPDLGRFLQPDPLRYIDTMNIYAYCGNNPVNWVDPMGLCMVHMWPPYEDDSNKWNGHVSVTLDDGTHISHWPADNSNYPYILPSEARQNTYGQDLAGEGFRTPQSFYIGGLDEAAMAEWWNGYDGSFSVWNNCCDAATEALRQGGLDVPGHLINHPEKAFEDIKDAADEPGSGKKEDSEGRPKGSGNGDKKPK